MWPPLWWILAVGAFSTSAAAPLFNAIEDKSFFDTCFAIISAHDQTKMPGTQFSPDSLTTVQSTCLKFLGEQGMENPVEALDDCARFKTIAFEAFDKPGGLAEDRLLPAGGGLPTGVAFCGALTVNDSYLTKTELIDYIPGRLLRASCLASINFALMEAKEAGGKADVKDAGFLNNLEFACQNELGAIFKDRGMPSETVLSPACKDFKSKAEAAIASGSFGGEAGAVGVDFCDGKSSPEPAFAKSGVASDPDDVATEEKTNSTGMRQLGVNDQDAAKLFKDIDTSKKGFVSREEFYRAMGFSGSQHRDEDGTQVTLDELRARIVRAFQSLKAAFDLWDQDKDTHLTADECKAGTQHLSIGTEKAVELLKQVDANGDGKASRDEYTNALGVDLEGLRIRVHDAFDNALDAFHKADKNGDGALDESEFIKHVEEVGVSSEANAKELFAGLDVNRDGKVDEMEYMESLGATLGDLLKKVNKAYKDWNEAFTKFDKNKDDHLSIEEFGRFVASIGLPTSSLPGIFKALDKSGDEQIDRTEFSNALGVDERELKRRLYLHMDNPKDAFAAMDTNMDGLLGVGEFVAGATGKLGLSEGDAKWGGDTIDAWGFALLSLSHL
ncbi:unnamed protein product [Vitrella brassicaformis CCMP3155]|uniref:EF-hand domain-containing protein n=1 Tax=Vitrella brassicaformis (strain CCMP3155) TaxID=1169540 RepID=A0A0G4H2A3_VITBC|nr:unnamed protein product [Vitrella brassicaformis CCMP3155]|eukprot:CEM37666.1 unnamed protein product [Vitrella brassicaformis CCMP3155]